MEFKKWLEENRPAREKISVADAIKIGLIKEGSISAASLNVYWELQLLESWSDEVVFIPMLDIPVLLAHSVCEKESHIDVLGNLGIFPVKKKLPMGEKAIALPIFPWDKQLIELAVASSDEAMPDGRTVFRSEILTYKKEAWESLERILNICFDVWPPGG